MVFQKLSIPFVFVGRILSKLRNISHYIALTIPMKDMSC